MIVTDKFVFIHLHKSGGTFINKAIKSLFSSWQQIGYHYPLSMLPREYCHLPVLGVVRNPWDFYVSYYTFQQSLIAQCSAKEAISTMKGNDPRNGIDILFEFLSNNGQLSFEETTTNFLNLGTSTGKLDEVLEFMPNSLGRRAKNSPIQTKRFRGMNVTRSDLGKIRETGEGLYTFLFKRIYNESQKVYFARTDSLREDVVNFFKHIGVKLDDNKKQHILTAKPENVSKHAHYSKCYSNTLENLVRERDAFVIDKFNFQFCNYKETETNS